MTPLALGIIVALPLLVGMRRDVVAVGPLVAWGVSLMQVALGIALVWMATREGRPARRLPRGAVGAVLAGAGFMVVAVSFLTFSKSPTHVPHDVPPWIAGTVCYFGSTLVATPFFALAAWFHSRFVSPRPALAGGLYGAGRGVDGQCGMASDLPDFDTWHVLTAHGGSVITITLLSALTAHLVANRTRRSSTPFGAEHGC